MKRILITGGAGFIGSNLADVLLARGDRILVLDNYLTGRPDNLAPHDNLETVEGSILDEKLTADLFDRFKPEVVVHAAASYKDPDDWANDVRTNSLGTALIVQQALRSRVERLIYFQTALCYGKAPVEQPISLNHPLRPESSYSISKTAGEQYIELSGIDYVSFRLANPIGPRTMTGPLPIFYQRLNQGKGCFITNSRRDYIFVGDLVRVAVKAIDGQGRSGPYHISSGRDFAIEEVWLATLKAMDLPPDTPVERRPRGEDEVESIFLDPSQTNRDFGWRTESGLEEAVKATIDWYREHGVEQTFTHLRHAKKES